MVIWVGIALAAGAWIGVVGLFIWQVWYWDRHDR